MLHALALRLRSGKVVGNICSDGLSVDDATSSRIGFVEQFDLNDDKATAREAIRFSARLRQSPAMIGENLDNFVEETIQTLEITHIQDALIESLSVEERKVCRDTPFPGIFSQSS